MSEKTHGLLIKFVEKQFTESTLKGNFYFSQSGQFIDLEKKQFDKGIGDSKEGAWSEYMNEDTRMVVEIKGERFPLQVKSGVFNRKNENLRLVPICCFTFLSLENDLNEDGRIKKSVIDSLIEQFGDRDMLLLDPAKFLERLDKGIENHGYNFKRDMIEYYDDKAQNHPIPFDEYEKYPVPALFYKRKYFEFQREYRVIIEKAVGENLLLNIGDISDIVTVLDISQLNDLKIEIKDENDQ